MKIGKFLQVSPTGHFFGEACCDVLQLFAKSFLNAWVSENVVCDQRERASGGYRSSSKESKRFSLETSRIFLRWGQITPEDVVENGLLFFKAAIFGFVGNLGLDFVNLPLPDLFGLAKTVFSQQVRD